MIGREGGGVDLAQPHGAVREGRELVAREPAGARIVNHDRAGDVALHHREHDVVVRVAAHLAVPGVVAGRARIHAHAIQRNHEAVEELDRERGRRDGLRIEVAGVEQYRTLAHDGTHLLAPPPAPWAAQSPTAARPTAFGSGSAACAAAANPMISAATTLRRMTNGAKRETNGAD